jgi:hypothetical protein
MNFLFNAFLWVACDSASPQTPPDFSHFFADKLRGSLFSGFLTLTGFLFAVKTFVVINMKKELYDTESYRARVWPDAPRDTPTVYGPLRRLSTFLLVAVMLSMTTAVSQLTIGLIEQIWATVICLALAVATIILLAVILYVIKCNLATWFALLEAEAKSKRQSELSRSARE